MARWMALALVRHGRPDDLSDCASWSLGRGRSRGLSVSGIPHGVTGAPGGTPSMAYTATGSSSCAWPLARAAGVLGA